jgi:hypothetical protein
VGSVGTSRRPVRSHDLAPLGRPVERPLAFGRARASS